MKELDKLQSRVASQVEAHPHWDVNLSPEDTIRKIQEELQELSQANETFEVTQDAEVNFVSEIGDVAFNLMILCNQLGIQLSDAVELKLVRNELKYPAAIQTNGYSRDEALTLSKTIYNHLGGDHAFYGAYGEATE